MKAKWLPISAAVALALGSIPASAVDFHGYARSGINYSAQGGNAYCLDKQLVGRLGNECDTYMELGFSETIFDKSDNKFAFHTTLAFDTKGRNWGDKSVDYQGNNWQDNREGKGAWSSIRTGVEEVYADYKMPSGINLWAGKRFYQRKDIHILDYYYMNNSGTGFGVEDIPVGALGSVSVALLKSQTDTTHDGVDADINSYKLDARWNSIPLWADGTLDAQFVYSWQKLTDNQKEDPSLRSNNSFLTMLEWTQGNILGGFNKLSFTFANNGFDNIGTGTNAADSAAMNAPYPTRGKGYRFIDWGVFEQQSWNLGYALVFAHLHIDDIKKTNPNGEYMYGGWTAGDRGNNNYFTIAVRPGYKWSDFTSTLLEVGYSKIPATSWNTMRENYKERKHLSATKVTLAQQWSPKSTFWARPSIRVFTSWLGGDLMENTQTGYKNDHHEVVLGAQMEAWW